ncbi:MAG: TetR/AcrR family transcriptional regulator [Nocardioidaceae bacterium]|nr:TetR/AcrR family transcriptional regulator [Nocardioidaceae bacterium]NUS49758.1 TetR/AcrR family transcriptional regulator [Nocardioidaceae bacterium]
MTSTARGAGRGRRPGGPDTKGEILRAARESFAHKGFSGTTIRGVAAGAGVDPALVHHYFGSKDDLFLAALEIPIDPRAVVPEVFADGVAGAGERLVRLFLSVWDDPVTRLPLVALVRTSLVSEAPETLLGQGMLRMVLAPLRGRLPADEADRRVQLVISQMSGLVVTRYLLGLEPLASMPADEVVAWVAPTVQRYLDGPLPD